MDITEPIAVENIEADLLKLYGPVVGNQDLQKILGFSSTAAFQQCLTRRKMPIPVFSIQNRRGRFALVKDVAKWLVQTRNQAILEPSTNTLQNEEGP